MAQYVVQQALEDIWQSNGLSSYRGPALTARVSYDFIADGQYQEIPAESAVQIHWTLPEHWPEQYQKKRLLEQYVWVYVRAKSLDASGALPNGSFAHFC